jgi:transcriptional regulator with XRE-family HTH domain
MPGVRNRNGNGNGNLQSLSALPSLSRGMYKRVAKKVGCDPSYVSRVARGERESKLISDELLAEIRRTWALVNNGASTGKARTRR